MSEDNYSYTYQVTGTNIETGTFVVEYMPVSANLTPISVNLQLIPLYYTDIVDANNAPIYTSQDAIPFELHLESTINRYAPLIQWRNQYMMSDNISNIESANGAFNLSANTVSYPSGLTVVRNPNDVVFSTGYSIKVVESSN